MTEPADFFCLNPECNYRFSQLPSTKARCPVCRWLRLRWLNHPLTQRWGA